MGRSHRRIKDTRAQKGVKRRMPNCDACYGKKTEECPDNCLTSHIRYEDEITCKAHLKCLESLKESKEACRICENHCNKIYYKDIHGVKNEFQI